MKPDFVSDTGPLISFERIPDGFSILRRMVGTVMVPPQVIDELLPGLPLGSDYLSHHGIGDLVAIEPAPLPPAPTASLDYGERYAISLASAKNLPLLIEDQKARAIAEQLGVPTIGALGVILRARDIGALAANDAEACVEALYRHQRISHVLFKMALTRIKGH